MWQGEKRKIRITKNDAIIIAGWVVAVFLLLFAIAKMQQFKYAQFAAYDAVNARTTQIAISDASPYRYIEVPGVKKPLLVEPKYKYQSQNDLWTLVNKSQVIGLSYVPKQLVPVPIPAYNDVTPLLVRPELVEPLQQLYAAATKDGIALMVRSAYRSSQEQAAVTKDVDQGYAAQPGQSEHQTGLAVDFNSTPITCGSFCYLDDASANWLKDNAYKYGFILRYPEGKEATTGYPAEAWHYRYVGKNLAEAIYRSNLTYEELYSLFATARPRT